MNILLHPKHEEFVSQQIRLGNYATTDEIIRAAIDLLQFSVRVKSGELAGDRVFTTNSQSTLGKSQMLMDM
ncbi:type II toxin-antitoxin system ParD family antitoxin [Microcoleus sp. herbarium7]|uniref:ribbon-helix-helix domain-containing protein n=1 Tax=Microcoleus sp. herbarium7 TaxID=3055435 RepID=UPI002FD0FDC4